MNKRKNILLIIYEYGEFPEVLRVAKILKRRTEHNLIVYFAKSYFVNVDDYVHEFHKLDIKCIYTEYKPKFGAVDNSSKVTDTPVHNRSSIVKRLLGDLWTLCNNIRRIIRKKREIASLFNEIKPSLIIVAQDNLGKELSFSIQIGRKYLIPIILVPFAMFNREEILQFARAQHTHQISTRPINALTAFLLPKWKAKVDRDKFLRLPGSLAIALEITGSAPKKPWVPCSEKVSAIACESKVAKNNLIKVGLDKEYMYVVGGPVHSNLAQITETDIQKWKQKYALCEKRPLLVCGWPVDMFAWKGGVNDTCFSNYEEVTCFWASCLATIKTKYNWDVFVSVHPKTDEHDLVVLQKYGIPYVKGNSHIAIKACDLFSTLNGSSITAWAIACNKPVVLFDCFQTKYPEFMDVPGCKMTYDKETFLKELAECCQHETKLIAMKEEQTPISADWGVLDDKSEDRIVELIQRFVS